MTLEVTGKLLVKYDAQQVSEKFKKREFVIELQEEINGNIYTNFAKMQLVQAKCDIIDRFTAGDNGDKIKVSFNIKGNSYVDKKDGTTKFITNLDAWKVEGVQQFAQQQQAQQPVSYYNNPAAAPGTFNQQQAAPANTAQGGWTASNDTVDDLPF